MAKIVCESCGSSFKYSVVKNLQACPVCQTLFDEDREVEDLNSNIDEMDFDNPDLYFYDIEKPGEFEDNEQGAVWCQCTSCREVNLIPYNDFGNINKDYLILKKGLGLTCEGCGKQISNVTVPKRPEGWRELNKWEKELVNRPKCITCGSTNIKKISTTSKVGSVAMWGLLSSKVHKQWHCNACGSEW